MFDDFVRSNFVLVYTDAEGTRRWPPLLIAPVPWTRRSLTIDTMQIAAIFHVSVIFLGGLAAILWFWTVGLTWFDVALTILCVFVVGLGTSLGYHRFFAHRTFQAEPWVATLLGILGASAMQGRILTWVSVHRRHHHHPDQDGDPHSPLPRGAGLKAAVYGFINGHVGWIVSRRFCNYVEYLSDLRKDPVVLWVDRWYWLWFVLGWIVPGLAGLAWYGTWAGYWSGLFAGGALRALFQFNTTGLVNSLAHVSGRRPFPTKDDSRNNIIVNFLGMNGEGFHNNHHAFPWSARLALFKGEIDPPFWVLRGFERAGFVRNVKIPSARQIAARAQCADQPLEAQ